MILVEKYRPNKFEDVIGIDERIVKACNKDMPHFLFTGPPGTGKTTTAKIIVKEQDAEVLLLNASDERGINVIREKVKEFVISQSVAGKLKIVFLDEGDFLTQEAQTSLRNLMETYSKNCRFIITGNYDSKFIDAIVSRCVKIEFKAPDKKEIEKRLVYISVEEKIGINHELIVKLIDKHYPDIRRCINSLQELSNLGRTITVEDLDKEEMLVEKLFHFLKQKNFTQARQMLLDNYVDYENLIIDSYHYVMKDRFINSNQKIKLIQVLCNCSKFMNVVISKELLFASTIIEIMKVLG